MPLTGYNIRYQVTTGRTQIINIQLIQATATTIQSQLHKQGITTTVQHTTTVKATILAEPEVVTKPQ